VAFRRVFCYKCLGANATQSDEIGIIKRRDFLKAFPLVLAPGTARLAADALRAANNRVGSDKPTVRQYNVLGKIGLQIGDIGFGVAVSTDPQLLVEAFNRGINYFDISPFYTWSVEMLAAAFARDARMRRDAIVASKLECESIFFRFSANPVAKLEECVDALLQKLGRGHIDILQLHSIGENGRSDLEWLDPATKIGAAVQTLFKRLKKLGKTRFAGVTSHGPKLLNEAMQKAIGADRFDMVMPALNFQQTPELRDHLRKAAETRVGVVAMKVLANARQAKIAAPSGRSFSQAAIAWALSQPAVNGVVITIKDREQLDEYLGASGAPLNVADALALSAFAAATTADYCATGCGRCAAACPRGVDVPTLLRIEQYWTNYRLPEFARERFADLPRKEPFNACATCLNPRRTFSCCPIWLWATAPSFCASNGLWRFAPAIRSRWRRSRSGSSFGPCAAFANKPENPRAAGLRISRGGAER
jgi:aryl-alcohol dehydrogenase-like predicted oxidoreductase